MYFKITNSEEKHNGFQYVDGLNILQEEFNLDPEDSCCDGGLYFTNAANIFKFLNYGIYLREVTLPTYNTNFLMLKDVCGDKWRANMIILGNRYDLSNVDTFKFLVEHGADIHAGNDFALCWAAAKGHLDVVKYLVGCGANIHARYALSWGASNGHLLVVKFLVESGANIHTDNELALRWAAKNGHLNIVKYLFECGAYIHAENDYAFRKSKKYGHSVVYDFLESKCVGI